MAAYFPGHFINPTGLIIEVGYSFLVIVLCLIIYFKTKKIYSLSEHEGMHYFRDTFLLFAVAYLLRLAFSIIMLSKLTFDIEILDIRRGIAGPLVFMLMGYISTAAILSLTMSTLWKKIRIIKVSRFGIHMAALGISIASVALRSFFILPISQLILLAAALFGGYSKYKESKKVPHAFLIYAMLLLFWVINLFALNFRGQHAPLEFKIPLYIISIAMFSFMFYKISQIIR